MSSAAVFGKRREPHTIIIARGDTLRHFTVRPWIVALAGAFVAAIAVGYLLATAYLVLRDDVLNAAVARQARMQYAYEDRIAALRSQVDRITSYRLLDQQIMETKVAELLTRQSVLANRSGRLAPLLEKAGLNGIAPTSDRFDPARIPVPQVHGKTDRVTRMIFRTPEPVGTAAFNTGAAPIAVSQIDATTPVVALSRLGKSLSYLEADQLNQISTLAETARTTRQQIVEDAIRAGLKVADPAAGETGTGGPFIPAGSANFEDTFDQELQSLNRELDALDQVRDAVRAFPIAHPAPGRAITSGFGNRRDPIIGRSAFHAGIDMSAPRGTPILAAGSGTVKKAGRSGGYGKLVEIEHANGLRTRYAHLSRISVKVGQVLTAGEKIGEAGSTGRSTGPHLHYEVRQGKTALNPLTYMKAGTRLNRYF